MQLASERNIDQVLSEFREYASEAPPAPRVDVGVQGGGGLVMSVMDMSRCPKRIDKEQIKSAMN